MKSVVVIGSGIMGLAHAITAREANYAVTLLERSTRPLGASVRNFGTLWPIGLAFGPEREQAMFGLSRWSELSKKAGFWADQCGSVSLAYRAEAWWVLQEFFEFPKAQQEGFEMLTAADVEARYPLVNPEGLCGALFSPHEMCIHPSDAIEALIQYARHLGVHFEFGSCAIKVQDDAVEMADGRSFAFDHCVIAAGDEMQLLFPDELKRAHLSPCKLQMMRSHSIGERLGAIFVSDLTLAHYPAFRHCPSLGALQRSLEQTAAEYIKWGIHVIAAQHDNGMLTLGDTHEYATDFSPEHSMHLDALVLEALAAFVRIPNLRISSCWNGIYLKSTIGQTQVVIKPRERVTMVTAMGGLGMTLSWGMARKTINTWKE